MKCVTGVKQKKSSASHCSHYQGETADTLLYFLKTAPYRVELSQKWLKVEAEGASGIPQTVNASVLKHRFEALKCIFVLGVPELTATVSTGIHSAPCWLCLVELTVSDSGLL